MPRTIEISNSDNVIDSRDVIARIEALQDERSALENAIEDAKGKEAQHTAQVALDNWDSGDEGQELKALLELADQAEGYTEDWKYGATLIRDSYFNDYAMELAEDVGSIPDNLQWPCTCIDWDQAARELKMDYTSVEFSDVTYWVR